MVNEVVDMENVRESKDKRDINISIVFNEKGNSFQEIMEKILMNKLIDIN